MDSQMGFFGEGEMATPARLAILFRAVFSVRDLEVFELPGLYSRYAISPGDG